MPQIGRIVVEEDNRSPLATKLVLAGSRMFSNYVLSVPLSFVVCSVLACLMFVAMQVTNNHLDLSFLQRFAFVDPILGQRSFSLDEGDIMRIYFKITFIFYLLFSFLKLLERLVKIDLHVHDSIWYGISFIFLAHVSAMLSFVLIGAGVQPKDKIGFVLVFLLFLVISSFSYWIYFMLRKRLDASFNFPDTIQGK